MLTCPGGVALIDYNGHKLLFHVVPVSAARPGLDGGDASFASQSCARRGRDSPAFDLLSPSLPSAALLS